jgi:hypothetical protein
VAKNGPGAGDRDVTDLVVGQLDLKVSVGRPGGGSHVIGPERATQPGGPPGRFILSEAVPGTHVPSARISLACPE